MSYQVYSNDDPRMTLTFLRARSNLFPSDFRFELYLKVDTNIFLKPKSLYLLDMVKLMRK